MSQLTLSKVRELETTTTDWGQLCKLGGVVTWIQFGCLLISMAVILIVGGEPKTAAEYYAVLQNDGLAGLLRLDFTTLIMLALFPFSAVAIYAALRRRQQGYALLGMVLILLGTILGLVNHSAFSLMHLSDLHSAATTTTQQEQLIAAGEAVIASDLWNSTAGFLAGLFMQGGFVFISLVMLRGKEFGRGTAYTGLIANGLDFFHVLVALAMPSLASILLYIGGIFYLFWFPLLGRDLLKSGRRESRSRS